MTVVITPTETAQLDVNETAQKAIGIFDSGFGGLSIAGAIQKLLPRESIHYIADTAYTPYGNLCPTVVTERAFQLTQALIDSQVKAIVVACNTATLIAIKRLREKYSLPFIGIEPGIKPAIERHTGTIAVLATQNTIRSTRFKNLVQRHAQKHPVVFQACPGFVELVEQGDTTSPRAKKIVGNIITPLIKQGVNTFVLGCTHYYFLANTITAVARKKINLIETSHAIAKRLNAQLVQHHLLNQCGLEPESQFFSTQLNKVAQTTFNHLCANGFIKNQCASPVLQHLQLTGSEHKINIIRQTETQAPK